MILILLLLYGKKKIKLKRKIVYLREVEIVGIYGYM